MSSCDVVIVNYNAIDLLADFGRSALAEGARYVFVVDNDSHDASLADLSPTISDVRVTFSRNDQNLGIAAACNIGARASDAITQLIGIRRSRLLRSPSFLPLMFFAGISSGNRR